MIRSLLALLTAVPLVVTPGAATDPPADRCAGLAGARIPQVSVASAERETNDEGQEFCVVQGVIRPQTRFTVKLPVSGWTGQYVQQGCSGLCGEVPDLTLPLFGFQCAAARDGKLVLASDDTGHTGDPMTSEPATWGADPRARLEFGLLSEHRLRSVADAVMVAYYGHGPTYRYFDGCSTGGRQGLMLAQRFPADFDGILAGAPVHNLAPLALLNAWVVLRNTDASGRQILGPEKIPALHEAVVEKCGEVIDDPRRCGFQPSSLRCPRGTDRPDCLTPAQVAAVVAFYRGPNGLYPGGMPYGSELGWIDEFVVRSGSPADGNTGRIAHNYLRYLAYPQNPPADFQLTDVRFTRATFDRLNVVGDAIYNATDSDLSEFRARGGRLILYHGWADPSVPPFSTVDYYAAVQRRGGSEAFTRLYMVPAGYHCLFGPEPTEHPSEVGIPEFLQPLMDWVERDVAPGDIDVLTYAPNEEPDQQFVRFLTVSPFDALAPAHAAPGSLNANYRYVGHY
ncbi:tannase/feruloyl esterase family alpha/beta hydrolase [Micromonospora sp. NPDC049275]|uniref:tannase/feruloyl esterase family alpha/beta hydrolase n=1 Tax=Micromonospora sp. NPDC049275 TaxID=3364268 RepID=UPI00372405B8